MADFSGASWSSAAWDDDGRSGGVCTQREGFGNDPYPDLGNIVYATRLDLAQKVDAKQMTPEAAELELAKVAAQIHDEEQGRTAAAWADAGQRLRNAGQALEAAGTPPPGALNPPVTCRQWMNQILWSARVFRK